MKTRILLGAVFVVAAAVIGFAYVSTNTPQPQTPAPSNTSANTSPANTAASSASSSAAQTYTLAQVAAHNSPSDCWTAINGKVYNVTSWISQHPGGPEHIIELCGIDGSAAFNGKHSGQSGPEQALAQMYVGDLAQ